MDKIVVGIIVAAAIAFTIKRFVNTFRGRTSCGCGSGCSCPSEKSCPADFCDMNKK